MRLVFACLFVVLYMSWNVSPSHSDEKPRDKAKEEKIAEIQQELADLRNRLATLESQLIELQAGTEIDLLGLVDIKRDTVSGQWELKDKHLFGPGTPDAKLAFPVRPVGDYEFTVKFKRHDGLGGPILCLPVGDRHVNFALDAYDGQFTALEAVDRAYVNSPQNPTQIKGKHIVTGKSHTLQATVVMKDSTATIRINLDGKQLADWTGNPNRLSLHSAWRLNDDRQIGLRSWQPFEYESAQLRMLKGKADSIHTPRPSSK